MYCSQWSVEPLDGHVQSFAVDSLLVAY